MGLRGPAGKPAKAHKRAGTFRADRHAEPAVAAATPAMPRGLGKVAQAAWRRIVPELERAGYLAAIDAEALRQLCEALADYEAAGLMIDSVGMLVSESNLNGDPKWKLNPAWTARKDSRAAILALLQRFGMTPTGRTGLGAKDEGGMSPELAALLGLTPSRN